MDKPDTLTIQVRSLEAERREFAEKRDTRVRGSNAHLRLTRRIAKLDKKIGYLKKCQKRKLANETRERINKLGGID